jgi:hypothetical protein
MTKTRFSTFPECCQKLLVQLEKEGRRGARNCAKGHAVSVEYALQVEAAAAKKAAVSSTS